ncbi:MAG TPA: creatininase family protein [Beijerinckiaceae bacterium]|jgi:creatinine amidohydrolase
MPARSWLDLTTEDFSTRDMGRAIALLPVAAVEQHGPHLPVGVDTFIGEGYLARLMERVPEDIDLLVLPMQAVGYSAEHTAFAGTLTLSAETAIRAWIEIGEGVRRAGCRKLVIANSHGGNVPVVDVVARELRVRHGMLVVTASWHRLGYPPGLFEADELRHGIHGGAVETSLMLAFRPDSVRREKAARFAPRSVAMERDFRHLRANHPVGFGWMAQDLHLSGAMGDAAAATPEQGEAAAEFAVEAFVDLLREVDRFELEGAP